MTYDFTIYTDGACLKNPGGPGGWAWRTLDTDPIPMSGTGFDPSTTNNRMELSAALHALNSVAMRWCDIHMPRVLIVTDSRYLIGGYRKLETHLLRGFRRSAKHELPNADLWKSLWEVSRKVEAELQWVRGHSGDPMNEWCDRQSYRAAARQMELPAAL